MAQLLDGRPLTTVPPPRPGHPPFTRPFHRGRLAPVDYRALPQNPVRGWEADITRAARNQSTLGFIGDLTDAAQFMLNDDALYSPLMRRIDGLLRSPVNIRPNPRGDKKLAQLVCDKATALWTQMFPLEQAEDWLRWWHMIDTGFATLKWQYDLDECVMCPQLQSFNPRYAFYDVGASVWRAPTWDTPETDVVVPGDGRWVVLTSWHYGAWAGAASRLMDSWIAKQYASRDWSAWSDFCANPILLARVPAGGQDSDDEKQNFVWQVVEGRQQRVIGVYTSSEPGSSYDVDKLDISNDGWENMQARINLVDRKYLMYFIGGNLSEISDNGSRAAADNHSNSEQEIIRRDSRFVSQVLRDQLLKKFTLENEFPENCTPTLSFAVALADENKAKADGYAAFTKALGQIPSGYQFDNVEELGADFGMVIKKVTQTLGAPPNKITQQGDGDKTQMTPTDDTTYDTDGGVLHSTRRTTSPRALVKQRVVYDDGVGKWQLLDDDGVVLSQHGSKKKAVVALRSLLASG